MAGTKSRPSSWASSAGSSTGRQWSGQLDDFSVWTRQLSDAEVSGLYAESRLGYPSLINGESILRFAPPSIDQFIGYAPLPFRKYNYSKPPAGTALNTGDSITAKIATVLPFNENGGLQIRDARDGRVGSIIGTTTCNWTANGWGGMAFNQSDTNGTTSLVYDNKNIVCDSTAYAISFWAYRDAASSGSNTLFPSVYNEGYDSFIIYYGDTYQGLPNGIRVWMGSDRIRYNVNVIDSKWHHVVYNQRSISDRELWVDGVLVASDTGSVGTFTSSHVGIMSNRTGPTSPYQYFTGKLDCLYTWRRSLSADEVRRLSRDRYAVLESGPSRFMTTGSVASSSFSQNLLGVGGIASGESFSGRYDQFNGSGPNLNTTTGGWLVRRTLFDESIVTPLFRNWHRAKPTTAILNPSDSLTSGLALAYLFNETNNQTVTNAVNKSLYPGPLSGFSGALPTWATGRAGPALSFASGTTQYVGGTQNVDLTANGQLTLAGWFQPTAVNNTRQLIAKRDDTITRTDYAMENGSSALQFTIRPAGTNLVWRTSETLTASGGRRY